MQAPVIRSSQRLTAGRRSQVSRAAIAGRRPCSPLRMMNIMSGPGTRVSATDTSTNVTIMAATQPVSPRPGERSQGLSSAVRALMASAKPVSRAAKSSVPAPERQPEPGSQPSRSVVP